MRFAKERQKVCLIVSYHFVVSLLPELVLVWITIIEDSIHPKKKHDKVGIGIPFCCCSGIRTHTQQELKKEVCLKVTQSLNETSWVVVGRIAPPHTHTHTHTHTIVVQPDSRLTCSV